MLASFIRVYLQCDPEKIPANARMFGDYLQVDGKKKVFGAEEPKTIKKYLYFLRYFLQIYQTIKFPP
jgi:hypothetical protein